jgi:GT2 family glycosyltransferase
MSRTAVTDPAGIDLAARPISVRFSDEARLSGAALDLFRGETLVFHLKYVALRKGFVLNDLREGEWGEERFVAFAWPDGVRGIIATLAQEEGGLQLRLPDGSAAALGDRFDLAGILRAALPAAIRLGDDPALADALPAAARAAAAQQAACDALVISDRFFFAEGWTDDRFVPVTGFTLVNTASGETVALPAHRVWRPDVDKHLQPTIPYEFGVWTAGRLRPDVEFADLALSLAGPAGLRQPMRLPQPTLKPPSDFLDFLLDRFGNRKLIGERTARSATDLDAGHGALLAAVHAQVAATRAIRLNAQFGPRNPACRLSLVCVLLGIPDFLYLLVAQFARFGPLDGMEFVFVSNSPELEEVLVRDAELASFVFGARIVLVGLNQNCGFSHANNVGVAAAQGTTIGIINPDVYPRDAAAVAHLRKLAEGDLGRNILGGKLYYADGSVMHDGMFFAPDRKLSALAGSAVWTVEHFRKGFPDTAATAPRAVPAVTGALMILDRSLYEEMQGFDTGYIFGHYEDADLCLRIRAAGGSVVLDPALAYWHYEGMGSSKRPSQAGARLYNRWLFARRWGDRLEAANDV